MLGSELGFHVCVTTVLPTEPFPQSHPHFLSDTAFRYKVTGALFSISNHCGTAVNNWHSAPTHKPITHESYKLKKKKKVTLF